jgi:hypothetical protein
MRRNPFLVFFPLPGYIPVAPIQTERYEALGFARLENCTNPVISHP